MLLPLQREACFGRLHRMGGLAGLTELSNQRAAIFRIRRPRPSGLGGRSQLQQSAGSKTPAQEENVTMAVHETDFAKPRSTSSIS